MRLGEYDTSSDPDCSTSGFCAPTVINHMISHVVIHPDYKNGQYHHDIALAILKTPLNYTRNVITRYSFPTNVQHSELLLYNEITFFRKRLAVTSQPICLYPDRENLIVGKRATVIGWGKLSHTARTTVMQFLDVPLTPWDQCSRTYSSTGALDSVKSVGRYCEIFI